MGKLFYVKAGPDDLSRRIIQGYQDACKEVGYKEVAFYLGDRNIPWLIVGVDEKEIKNTGSTS